MLSRCSRFFEALLLIFYQYYNFYFPAKVVGVITLSELLNRPWSQVTSLLPRRYVLGKNTNLFQLFFPSLLLSTSTRWRFLPSASNWTTHCHSRCLPCSPPLRAFIFTVRRVNILQLVMLVVLPRISPNNSHSRTFGRSTCKKETLAGSNQGYAYGVCGGALAVLFRDSSA